MAPVAAHATPPPVATYGALPAMQSPQLSPSGKLMLAYLNKGGDTYLVVQAVEAGGKPLYSAKVNDRNGGALWADDDHIFVHGHRTQNTGTAYVYEQGFIFLVDLKAGKSTQIAPTYNGGDREGRDTGSVADVGDIEAVIRKDGRAYAYFEEGSKLYRVDVATQQIVPVARFGADQGGAVLNADGDVVARHEVKDHARKWRVLPGETGDTTLASSDDDLGHVAAIGLGRTKDTILTAFRENTTTSNFREVDVRTGKTSGDLVEGIDAIALFDRNTRQLIGFELGNFEEDAVFLDDKIQHDWESVKAAFPGRKVRRVSTNEDRTRWTVYTSGPKDSGHYYMIDLPKKRAVPLGAAYPDIKDADVGFMNWFNYKAGDGKDLKALVTLPPGYTMETARRLPAVVMPHGGPQGRDDYGFHWWAQAIASRGYVVIQPQFRGSGGFGQAFEREGWGQWGKLMQTDVSDALAAVAAKGIVDPARVCIHGWSYGGYATLAGVTLQNGIYRCAVAGAAPADLNAMLVWSRDRSGKLSYTMRYWKKSMALKGESDPAGAAISPARNVANVTAPLMVIHGRQDTTVPIEQGDLMVEAMRKAGKSVEYVVLENETHNLESASTRTKMLEATIGFLLRYNPPDAGPRGLVSVEKTAR